MTEKQLLENFDALCPIVVEKYATDWKNVMELEITARDLPALPFYWSLPDDNLVEEEKKEDKKTEKVKKSKKPTKSKKDSKSKNVADA